jgi:hypothetical protein
MDWNWPRAKRYDCEMRKDSFNSFCTVDMRNIHTLKVAGILESVRLGICKENE